MVATKQNLFPKAAIILLVLLVGLLGYRFLPVFYGPVMAIGVSKDGQWVVTTHRSNELVLWNLSELNHQKVSGEANIYSAFFVGGQPNYLWQDLNNNVYRQNVSGNILEQFEHFPVYGHAYDHQNGRYWSVDEHWNLFLGHGESLSPVLRDSNSPSFVGTGKLLNISLSDSGLLLTAGRGLRSSDERLIDESTPPVRDSDELRFSSNFGGVVLWNTETLQPAAKLSGNSSKTHATISPDGQWVISGDENGIGLYWNTEEPEKRYRLASYHSGIYIDETPYELGDPRNRDTSELIDAPSGTSNTTIAQAFIHNSQYYLRFGNNSHIAALFETGSPWPVKYFDLGESPELVTYGSQYARNTAIATAPKAGVLVMGHRSGGGISVYRFDAEALTLEREWVVE